MIIPRQLLLFETLSDLQTVNFTIHTRIVKIFHNFRLGRVEGDFYQRKHGSTLPKMRLSGFSYLLSAPPFNIRAYTEIHDLAQNHPEYGNERNRTRQDLEVLARLLNITTLSTKTLQVIRSNAENQTRYPFKVYKNETISIGDKLSRQVYLLEDKAILDELIGGEKVAVLTPVSDALTFRIKSQYQRKDVYIGKETYASGVLAMDIAGDVHFSIIRRIWSMRESGIMNWLDTYFDPV